MSIGTRANSPIKRDALPVKCNKNRHLIRQIEPLPLPVILLHTSDFQLLLKSIEFDEQKEPFYKYYFAHNPSSFMLHF